MMEQSLLTRLILSTGLDTIKFHSTFWVSLQPHKHYGGKPGSEGGAGGMRIVREVREL